MSCVPHLPWPPEAESRSLDAMLTSPPLPGQRGLQSANVVWVAFALLSTPASLLFFLFEFCCNALYYPPEMC